MNFFSSSILMNFIYSAYYKFLYTISSDSIYLKHSWCKNSFLKISYINCEVSTIWWISIYVFCDNFYFVLRKLIEWVIIDSNEKYYPNWFP